MVLQRRARREFRTLADRLRCICIRNRTWGFIINRGARGRHFESRLIRGHCMPLIFLSLSSKVTDRTHTKVLVSSIKGEVKKKHISFGWNFSCFSAHLMERDLF